MNSQKFRNHPGGIKAIVAYVNVALLIGIIGSILLVIISLVAMFSENVSLMVTSNVSATNDIANTNFSLKYVKTTGLLNFIPRNVIEWLFLPRYQDFDVYLNLISLLITWQLYRVFKEINMDSPFYEGILKRITLIYRLIFFGFIFSIARHGYLVFVIRDVSADTYTLSATSFLSSSGYFSFGTWVIVYLFAHVYKNGVLLQQERELTI